MVSSSPNFFQTLKTQTMVFGLKMKILTLGGNDFFRRASQEEQNDAYFSFLAPPSEEL